MGIRERFINRPGVRVGLAALAVTLAAMIFIWGPGPAQASPPIVTYTYGFDGEVHHWPVPAGVASVQIEVAGASGGFTTGGPPAPGGVVTADVPVSAGQVLAVVVGEAATGAGGTDFFGGGGLGGRAGGGGSFVFTSSGGGWSPLVIAGGGGGRSFVSEGSAGGAGGFAGGTADGGNGQGSIPGTGGTLAGPGGGMIPGSPQPASYDGTTFIPGHGGRATEVSYVIGLDIYSGSGGGGGYFGGSGGLNAGGGGGSGYLAPGLTAASTGTNLDHGRVVITYEAPQLPPVTQPPSTAPNLALRVSPRKKRIGAGKQVKVRAAVANRGSAAATRVKVCAKFPKKKVKLAGKKCRTNTALAAGRSWKPTFRFRKTAKGKQAKVRFTVTAGNNRTLRQQATIRRR